VPDYDVCMRGKPLENKELIINKVISDKPLEKHTQEFEHKINYKNKVLPQKQD